MEGDRPPTLSVGGQTCGASPPHPCPNARTLAGLREQESSLQVFRQPTAARGLRVFPSERDGIRKDEGRPSAGAVAMQLLRVCLTGTCTSKANGKKVECRKNTETGMHRMTVGCGACRRRRVSGGNCISDSTVEGHPALACVLRAEGPLETTPFPERRLQRGRTGTPSISTSRLQPQNNREHVQG